MKKVLFLIHDLGPGGAEKVLLNLVNNMDPKQFDITVMSLFDVGVNRQFLAPHITYKACFKHMLPGNSHMMKLLSPKALHKWLIKEHYDVEVAYLEGPCARIISGCPHAGTKKVAWIHIEQHSKKCAAGSFRRYKEAIGSYNAFDRIICVSKTVRKDFLSLMPVSVQTDVLYNTNETQKIITMAAESIEADAFPAEQIKLVGVGKLLKNKGFHRLIPMIRRLREEGFPVHLYILGVGPTKEELEKLSAEQGVQEHITLLGYQTNPYKYVAACDLFVCASYAEGFSTAATEALIVGTPVCTVEVSGMKEMLGDHNEWGIVTDNDNEALYQGIRRLVADPAHLAQYAAKAKERGKSFSTENTVKAVQDMLLSL